MLMYYVFYVRQYLSDSLVIAEKTYPGTVLHKQGCFIIKCIVIVYNNIIQLLIAKQQDYIGQERINLSHLVMVYTLLSVARHLVMNLQEDVT